MLASTGMLRPLTIVLLITVLWLSACTEPPEDVVRIGIHVWPGYDTLILARDKNLLADANVRLIELPSASESIRAFQNRTVDGALLTVDEVLRLADHGHDPVIILVMDFSNGADAVLAQPQIDSLAALKGKTIGVEPNALGAYVLARALDTANLSSSDVTLVSMPIAETTAAFTDRQVDAVVTYEPHRTHILDAGAKLLFDSTQMPGEIMDVLVVHREVIERSPKALQRLVDAQFSALEYLAKQSDEAVTLMANRENITPAELRASLTRLELPDRQGNQQLLSVKDTTLPDTIRRLITLMREQKMLDSDLSEREFRNDRFVRD